MPYIIWSGRRGYRHRGFCNACQSAAELGVERVTCTPHVNHKYRNTPESIRQAFEQLQEAMALQGSDLELKMSAEYRLVPETWPEMLEKNWLMPIEDKYILMELPITKPEKIRDIKPLEEFRKIISMGLTPILPHPERYFYLAHEDLMSFVEEGVKIQCNYGSLYLLSIVPVYLPTKVHIIQRFSAFRTFLG